VLQRSIAQKSLLALEMSQRNGFSSLRASGRSKRRACSLLKNKTSRNDLVSGDLSKNYGGHPQQKENVSLSLWVDDVNRADWFSFFKMER
jgi:hypothetical protein